MDVLILGLSSIVTRRALTALQALPSIGRIDVATRRATDPEVVAGWTPGSVYGDYSEALEKTGAQLVYVSLVNSEHERWARAAIEQDRHVVVDKPAFLGSGRAEALLDLADRKGVCLAEATVFGYHPQVTALKQAFAEAGSAPTRIAALFSFPPMAPDNFRYQASLGGGALLDVGPYLAATSRIFFGDEPTAVTCEVLSRTDEADGVETAFSALGLFSEGRSLVGQFGFDTGYINRIELLGPGLTADADRIFTTPPDFANTLLVSGLLSRAVIDVAPADTFHIFFDHVARSIDARSWAQLGVDLLSDARTLERYRAAAGVT